MAELDKDNKDNNLPEGQNKYLNPSDASSKKIAQIKDTLPAKLPLLMVPQAIIFPGMIVPLIFTKQHHKNVIDFVLSQKNQHKEMPYVGIAVSQKVHDGVILPNQLFHIGIAARILKKINLPDGGISVLVSCIKRFRIAEVFEASPDIFIANASYHDDIYFGDTETEAYARAVVNQFKAISQDNPLINEEMRLALANVDGPGKMSDLLSSILIRDHQTYLDFLSTFDVKKRLEKLLLVLKKETDVYQLQSKITDQINQNVSKTQREFFLNEQLKLIKKELGHTEDEKTNAFKKFSERAAKLKFSAEAEKKYKEEIEKLNLLNENSPEYGVTYNYLDWLTSLPWGISSKENHKISNAQKVLEEDHYGLEDVKDRILEFIAVRKLKNDNKGSIICLVGPPGVGKTSLGKSIARALNRPFFRFSVGGMRDEAEIKGHRRTYIGAMPGKVIQGLKKAGVNNPVFMIDEVDKMGHDFRGDPSSALLEVLDPEQNVEFMDHYLDVNFDASQILFVCTANQLDTIPQPLLDRMQVIRIPGYIMDEKLAIAEKYILPKQLKKNGLKKLQLNLPKNTIKAIIEGYAREAGVRSLEQFIEQICRKQALKIATNKKFKAAVLPKDLEDLIGAPYFTTSEKPELRAGMSIGLAWTAMGGDTLTIESVAVDSKEAQLKLTGQMGNVMTESANIAWTYVKKMLSSDKKASELFKNKAVHLHIPAGAVPKDGPSAGITLATSLYSLAKNKKIKPGFAMTGELTLTGLVLPVGGIREKVIAARRNGYKNIILPFNNKRDLKEIPKSVKAGLKFYPVKTFEEVIKHTL
ncbi:MAG: endopeptidase La [Oligoflexia bacterium]|nr:endopeptidase La [Oligoflexia bacterium]